MTSFTNGNHEQLLGKRLSCWVSWNMGQVALIWLFGSSSARLWFFCPVLAFSCSYQKTKRHPDCQGESENVKYNPPARSTGSNSLSCYRANIPGPWPRLWTYKMLFVLFVSTRSAIWSPRWITWRVLRPCLRWWPCPAQYRWWGSLSASVTDRKSSARASVSPVTASVGRRIKVSKSWWIQ